MTAGLGGIGESYGRYDFAFREACDAARRNSDYKRLLPSAGRKPFPKELQSAVLLLPLTQNPHPLWDKGGVGFGHFQNCSIYGFRLLGGSNQCLSQTKAGETAPLMAVTV
jgi:hypothetical protein